MPTLLYITHPEVTQDATLPVQQWGLNVVGRERARVFATRGILDDGTRFVASSERKAQDLAEILAAATGGTVTVNERFNETDRSATGFLSAEEFTEAIRQLYGNPETSYRGWESAADAQRRIVSAVAETIAATPAEQPLVFCGHGTIGTLLKCALSRKPIARSEDQRLMAAPGGGNIIAFGRDMTLISDWQALEAFSGAKSGRR